MVAAFTSISPHPSFSSLYHKFHPSLLAYSLNSSIESTNLSNRGRNSSTYGPLRIQNAATKPAKSPAEEDWKTKRQVLLEKKVRSVDVKEALRLQKENNFVILDVRPEAEFKEAHPAGAINVQIYRLIKEWTAWDIARRAAFAFFGIFQGTEENPEFIQSKICRMLYSSTLVPLNLSLCLGSCSCSFSCQPQNHLLSRQLAQSGVESKLDKDAKIIVACSAGGTTRPTQNLPEGQQSRSFIAAYLLVLNGYKNVYHLDGGIYQWFKEGLPSESEE
ncbi:rhodanese-like domain-containing protein 14, chloroplastic isoform X1 [Salvia miltiorrhiza]|uniref:rhodanese-like domain-containing protein 14, chloroplastic isoform X1 n=1 Tax=Salvia miltiorrhiza TaxID=226208 RepID=UPI0025AB98C9|nr:rhodanese-like domain-containing protein 14, chloroplastic isoform X1 [Salvia miltiorrhiza]